jgi:outer membrane protein assembly factor BamA
LADPLGLPQNEVGQWMLANVPFTQFVRWEGFWTWNALFDKSEDLSWHGRCMMGVGATGENYPLLPFDRAFYSGGVNGMRGWSARQLGPGFSSSAVDGNEAVVVKGLGDLKLECNVEVRQKITEALELAWFMDFGNVWILKNEQQGALSEDVAFSWKSFGLSSGLGVRLDFDFFLLRLDGGLRLHDPGNPAGQRWVGESNSQGAFHLGIGHPF